MVILRAALYNIFNRLIAIVVQLCYRIAIRTDLIADKMNGIAIRMHLLANKVSGLAI